ncbi:MAG: hypothetical protein ACREQE_02320 [Candidatus Binataceae bacterium]
MVITPCEVNELHGTGALLLRMFPDSSSIISLRTSNFYDGEQTFGAARLSLPLAQASRPRNHLVAEMVPDRHLRAPIPEAQLPEVLSQYPYAVVPSDTLDGQSPPSVRAIAELSLPSRIPTMVATSHLPILVIGHPRTRAARFVERFDLGAVVPYEREAVRAALGRLMTAERQSQIRRRAANVSESFSARDSSDWIWRSPQAGQPCGLRYET